MVIICSADKSHSWESFAFIPKVYKNIFVHNYYNMKKLFYSMMLGCLSIGMVQGQTVPKENAKTAEDAKKMKENPEGWKVGGTGSLTFNQVGLKNWAAGGDPSISFLFLATPYADLKSGKHLWQNRLGAEYGLQKLRKEPFRKNSDRLELFTKYGYQVSNDGKWYVGAYANFKSQFTKTRDYASATEPVISKFANPLYIETALGIDYIPNDKFSLFMSPIAAKMTIVSDDSIAMLNLYGNDVDPTDGKIQNLRVEAGISAIATYKQEIVKNVTVLTTLKLYKDYLKTVDYKGDKANLFADIDVDWQTTIGMKVNKYITANVFTHLIWDNDMATPDYNDSDVVIGSSAKVQFKDVIGVGLSYSMAKVFEKGEQPQEK